MAFKIIEEKFINLLMDQFQKKIFKKKYNGITEYISKNLIKKILVC